MKNYHTCYEFSIYNTLYANFSGTYTVGGVGRSNENKKCITTFFLKIFFKTNLWKESFSVSFTKI